MSRSAAIDSSAAAATTASAPPPAPSHSLGPLWPLGALLGLVYVHQEGVQVQAVWQDEVSDVVAAHAHMVQRDGVLAARHKLDGLQMRVHRHIYASDCALDDGPVLELDLDRLVGEFHQKADELHHPAKERRALANPSPVCLLLDRHRYWLGGDEAAQQIASRGLRDHSQPGCWGRPLYVSSALPDRVADGAAGGTGCGTSPGGGFLCA
mmetsp:Transcript_28638/g.80655  ORF Transcript_28638/g.80655 Transcript_28638/m.80655 type:complete len:209 (+) Transcript_28638:257-883(+)